MAKQQKSQNVTRISASDERATAKPAKKVAKAVQPTAKKSRSFGPIGSFFGYFKGAWAELRQVHWPTRRATWGLTGAVLLFSLFFVIFITALDAGFRYIFEQILGS